jgi:Zn-finger nucleic acid-binding protein
MNCPDCQVALRETDHHGIKIDECPRCLGRWFERDELRRAKDNIDDDLRWLDFDPFARDAVPASGAGRLCPRCSDKMGAVVYETSSVVVDKCPVCHGIWLDHDEFEKIVEHLKSELWSDTAGEYSKETMRQFAQIVTGPEGRFSELRDFLAVLHLLKLRIAVEHPDLAHAIETINAANPLR